MFITFVIPVYNEKDTLRGLVDGIKECTPEHERRVLFVDDGSTDGSRSVLDELAAEHDEVEAIHFDENRGKTAALARGIDEAAGDVVITMDSDLQDDPSDIPRFLSKLEEGYDLVCGWKAQRQDPLARRLASRVYNGVTARAFGLRLHDINCGFKAMRIGVAKDLRLEHDYHRLIPVLAAHCGYSVTEIEVTHQQRRFGRSKYGWARFWHGARDVARLWWSFRRNDKSGG